MLLYVLLQIEETIIVGVVEDIFTFLKFNTLWEWSIYSKNSNSFSTCSVLLFNYWCGSGQYILKIVSHLVHAVLLFNYWCGSGQYILKIVTHLVHALFCFLIIMWELSIYSKNSNSFSTCSVLLFNYWCGRCTLLPFLFHWCTPDACDTKMVIVSFIIYCSIINKVVTSLITKQQFNNG